MGFHIFMFSFQVHVFVFGDFFLIFQVPYKLWSPILFIKKQLGLATFDSNRSKMSLKSLLQIIYLIMFMLNVM